MNRHIASTERPHFARTFAAACAALAVAQLAFGAESFYERKPADIFMGEGAKLTVDVVSVSDSGTVKADLSNGMVVLLKENHTAPVAIVQVTVKTGSIYEQEYLGTGISHLFEHLMSGGTTTTRTEEETRTILESLGNMTNAYTSTNSTSYFIKTAAPDVDTAIGLLADWMVNTQVTEKEFDREMKVVQRESERTYTSPDRVLFRMAGENMFRVHPVRYPIIGYDHVRAKLTIEDVRRYRARMYVPNNMAVVAVGDFKWPDVLEKIRAAFEGFPRGAALAIPLPKEPEQVSRRVMKKSLANLNTTLLTMSCRTVRLTHPDLYPLDVMAAVLGHGESSRLVRIIRNERSLVQSISAWSYTPGFDAGRFTVFTSVPQAENVDEVIEAVKEQIRKLQTEPVDETELARVKTQVAANHIYGSEKIGSQARSIVSSYLSAGDPDFDARYVAGIKDVTAEEVRRVANEYFSDDKLCLTIVEPKGEGPPEARLPEALEATPVQKSTLKNGLTLLLKRNPNVPVVAFELYFLAGLRAETTATSGISSFAASLWGRSTKLRSQVELAAQLEGMGASLSTGSGSNTFFLRAICLSKDFEEMVEIIGDVVINPAFDPDECEKLRVRI
ncbi:MAG: insulinase family protein, partial [Planctomycetes bacterium]|nr:insulinase family protein [Planctomycetota bacterium]